MSLAYIHFKTVSMEHISLNKTSQNEDISSMSIAINKNSKVIEKSINLLIDALLIGNTSTFKISVLELIASENEIADDNFKVVRTKNQGVATFTVTPIDKTIDMMYAFAGMRTFQNEIVLCPIIYSSSEITFKINNLSDVDVTNVVNPANDVNNKKIIIIHFTK